MKTTELEWRPITEKPKTQGYVLLAIKHNNLNSVIMGHYSHGCFRDAVYANMGNTQYEYWAEALHPDGEDWRTPAKQDEEETHHEH